MLGKSGIAIPRTDIEENIRVLEVIDSMLPGKASKHQVVSDRTANRHR